MAETISSIAQWCDETFGAQVTPKRVAERANEEMSELLDETTGLSIWTDKARIEAADVFIVLCRVPGIWEAVEAKMAINRRRQWRLTGDGCGYHIPASGIVPASADETAQQAQPEGVEPGGEAETPQVPPPLSAASPSEAPHALVTAESDRAQHGGVSRE